MSDLTALPALVLKTGWFEPGNVKRPVIVTAGAETVYLALADDMRNGIAINLRDWCQFVDFVESQILAAHESAVVNAAER